MSDMFIPVILFLGPSKAPNASPLSGSLVQTQVNRRHTLVAGLNPKMPIARALSSSISVPISPLGSKQRNSLSTAALINSARKAMQRAKIVTEQQKQSRAKEMEGAQVIGAYSGGNFQRTPLRPVNSRAIHRKGEKDKERAASTPEGIGKNIVAGTRLSLRQHTCVIDQVGGQGHCILTKFFFLCIFAQIHSQVQLKRIEEGGFIIYIYI